jgi:hypothetical protein
MNIKENVHWGKRVMPSFAVQTEHESLYRPTVNPRGTPLARWGSGYFFVVHLNICNHK